MFTSPAEDASWERVWRESTDEQLAEAAKSHLWQCLQSPEPGFSRLAQVCREAHRCGKPELLMRAVEVLAPVRTADGEDVRVLLRVIERLTDALSMAGKEMVRIVRVASWPAAGFDEGVYKRGARSAGTVLLGTKGGIGILYPSPH
jgi:hypothetical protein